MAIQYAQSKRIDTRDNAVINFLSSIRLVNEQEDQESEVLALLLTLLRQYGNSFVEILSDRLNDHDEPDSDKALALTLLGRVEHRKTQASRLKALLENVSSPRVRVRDGAVAGLAYIMSKDAIPVLELAANKEKNRFLQRDMTHLLELLKEM